MAKLTDIEIAQAYCANEFYSGYPCGTEDCPTCCGIGLALSAGEQAGIAPAVESAAGTSIERELHG